MIEDWMILFEKMIFWKERRKVGTKTLLITVWTYQDSESDTLLITV